MCVLLVHQPLILTTRTVVHDIRMQQTNRQVMEDQQTQQQWQSVAIHACSSRSKESGQEGSD